MTPRTQNPPSVILYIYIYDICNAVKVIFMNRFECNLVFTCAPISLASFTSHLVSKCRTFNLFKFKNCKLNAKNLKLKKIFLSCVSFMFLISDLLVESVLRCLGYIDMYVCVCVLRIICVVICRCSASEINVVFHF